MAKVKRGALAAARSDKLRSATKILAALGFSARQSNEVAAYTLLALLDLGPMQSWSEATEPLRGITPIIDFVAREYGLRYAPNTRETIRDEAVKYFVDAGIVIRNPDDPSRPTNSGKTVYQIEPHALEMLRVFKSPGWNDAFGAYLHLRNDIRDKLLGERKLSRIPIMLPSGECVTISPGGQNPLIKLVVEEFCARFVPGGTVIYIGDAEDKFLYLDTLYLKELEIVIPSAAKMPDIVVHDVRRNWLLLVEVVTSAGPIDHKRRKELKDLFISSKVGLVFVSAFSTRDVMRSYLTQLSWETEVWIAEDPDHLIHFNGERFLGPYPDVMPVVE